MGCDTQRFSEYKFMGDISIHAPTWGATAYTIPTLGDPQFQSTHPRGVRHTTLIVPSCLIRFQSTHPRGVRLKVILLVLITFRFQSTHPRGVRHSNPTDDRRCHADFNPRTHVGCDDGTPTTSLAKSLFQSTHPRGVRLLSHQMVGF